MPIFTDYYPYGMPHATSLQPAVNRYKHGSKELITELGLNLYDYHARLYDPVFPRFHQPDPHAWKYLPLSPNIFCATNPINIGDPSGKDGVIIADDENQTLTIVAHYYIATQPLPSKNRNPNYKPKDIDAYKKYNNYLNNLNLMVEEGEYSGYTVKFECEFIDGGSIENTKNLANTDYYDEEHQYNIGHTIELVNSKTYKIGVFEKEYDAEGNWKVAGGVTDPLTKKNIYMNQHYDSKMNRIHEIFHTFGMNDDGGESPGIMHYPPDKPIKTDIYKILQTKYLPIIPSK